MSRKLFVQMDWDGRSVLTVRRGRGLVSLTDAVDRQPRILVSPRLRDLDHRRLNIHLDNYPLLMASCLHITLLLSRSTLPFELQRVGQAPSRAS